MTIIASGDVEVRLSPQALTKIENELNGSLKKSASKAAGPSGESFAQGFGSSFKSAIGGIAKSAAAVFAAGVAGAGALAAIGGKAAHTFAEVGGEVKKLQRFTGGSAEAMSKLRFAAKQSGVDVDKLGTALGLLSKHAAAGDKTMTLLGVSAKDARGKMRPLDDVLGDVAERFKNLPNGIEKNRLALAVFGRTGTDLLPFLSKGKAGLAELGAEAKKFGLVLTQNNLDAISKNVVAQRNFKAALEGLQVQIGQFVLPVLTRATEFLSKHLGGAITFVSDLARKYLVPAFEFGFSVLEKVIDTGRDAFGRLVAFVQTKVVPVFRATLIPLFKNEVLPAFKSVSDFIGGNLTAVLGASALAIGTQVGPLADAITGLAGVFALLVSPVGLVVVALAGLAFAARAAYKASAPFREAWDGIFDSIRSFVRDLGQGNPLKEFLQGLTSTFVPLDPLGSRFTELGRQFSGAFEFMQTQLGNFTAFIREIFPQIEEAIGHFVALASAAWQLFGEDIQRIVGGAFGSFIALVQGALNLIANTIRLVLAVINGDWTLAGDALEAIVFGTFEAIKGIVTGAVQQVLGVVRLAFHAMGAAASAGLSMMNELLGGIPGKIISAVGNLGSTLYNAGRSVISGLITGILDGMGPLGTALRKVGKFISDHKGPIDKDRVLLIPHGMAVMDGLIAGMQRRQSDLAAQLSATTRMLQSGGVPNFALAGGGGGGTAGARYDNRSTVVHINNPPNDPDATAFAVARTLGQASQR